MDNQGWIKLYRKIGDHEIIRDAYGLQIFIWLLIHVDRATGQYTSGRFVMSEALKIKPRTLHKVVTERLQNRYHLVTLLSDNKKTTFSICKWQSYQENSDTKSDTKVTPGGQQSDTKQEVRSKNKEYKHIDSINEELAREVATQYSVPLVAVNKISEDLKLYCQSKGKKYANYKAALQNWVRRAVDQKRIPKIATQPTVDEDPDFDPEIAKQNLAKIMVMKKNVLGV